MTHAWRRCVKSGASRRQGTIGGYASPISHFGFVTSYLFCFAARWAIAPYIAHPYRLYISSRRLKTAQCSSAGQAAAEQARQRAPPSLITCAASSGRQVVDVFVFQSIFYLREERGARFYIFSKAAARFFCFFR